MTTTRNPEAVYLIAQQLLTCALDQVNTTWSEEPDITIERACVVWGAIAWDSCECGQLVVAIQDQWPSSAFPSRPSPTTDQSRCGPPLWVVQYGVNILRCASSQGDDGAPPPCEDLSAEAQINAVDSWAVRTGVSCCLTSMSRDLQDDGAPMIADFHIVGQTSQGPAGSCAGSELTVQVGLRNCFCPPGGSS